MPRNRNLGTIFVALGLLGGSFSYNASAQASEGKAPTAADRRETEGWLRYDYNGTIFRYPKGWKVEPILWQSAAQEEAGQGPDEIGITFSPAGGRPRAISYGGRGASCDDASDGCKCFEIYDAFTTCSQDVEVSRVFDLMVTTIRNDSRGDFTVVSPAAQDALHPNHRYTIRWKTKDGTPPHSIDITVRDTSKLKGTVLEVKNVPNIGRYEWVIPAAIASAGPYLIEISFVVPVKVKPPALSGGRIYSGVSSPFYIQ